MKTSSINIINSIKELLLFMRSEKKPFTLSDIRTSWQQIELTTTEKVPDRKEKIDIALFQRKAYCGNFFAGPYFFFHPGLLER